MMDFLIFLEDRGFRGDAPLVAQQLEVLRTQYLILTLTRFIYKCCNIEGIVAEINFHICIIFFIKNCKFL